MENKNIYQVFELRRLRESRGKTLSSVATECGISIALLCKLEKGEANLTPKSAEILSSYYDCKIIPCKIKKTFVGYKEKPSQRILDLQAEISDLKQRLKAANKVIKNYEKAEKKALNGASKVIFAFVTKEVE